MALDYAQESKESPIPIKEGFGAKHFLLKHVKVREYYMFNILCTYKMHVLQKCAHSYDSKN